MFVPPYRVSLSGGGIKGFAHIGVLEVLHEKGMLVAVREYIGISAGALCAMALSIGCSLSEIRRIICDLDFGQIRDLDPETMLNFPDTFGMDTGANLGKLIGAILKAKGLEPTITFQEMAASRLGPSLRVFATNMNRCMAQEFSATASPGVEVRFAVQASMSVPIYFTPLKDPVSGHLFLDGGILCPSPMQYLTYEEQCHTLAVSFSDVHKQSASIDSLGEFIYQLYYSLDYQPSVQLKARWPYNTIVVDCGNVNMVDFEAGSDAKIRIIETGRRAAEAFLKSPGYKPVRRFSVA
jgi:NTE family protein